MGRGEVLRSHPEAVRNPAKTFRRMSDHQDPSSPEDGADEAASLRHSLERMREQAVREINRLNQRLMAREHDVSHSVASETERLALQQELMLLRQTLGMKEQALDRITQACRRLEDQLEDRNLAFDDLQQEVEQRELSLRQARDEVERLQQALAELQNRPAVEVPEAPQVPMVVRRSPPWWQMLLVILIVAPLSLWVGMQISHSPISLSLAPSASAPGGEPVAAPPPVPVKPPMPQPEPPATVTDAPAVASADGVAARPESPRPTTLRDWMLDGAPGPLMVRLAGGRFGMGQDVIATEDDFPLHEVEVAPFLIGAYEVTFDEYDRFASATGRRQPSDQGWGRGLRPVVDVSWADAQAYVAWLSEQSGYRYRLPTEAEWEFAARAGTRSPFWWGYAKGENHALCFDCSSNWDNRSTAPVGRFAPNPFGLFDTAGNAAEWVADCYVPGYRDAPDDGSARELGACASRVARGGAFNKPADSIRSHARARFAPSTRLKMLGFRVARDP